MDAVVLALCTALAWGFGDFAGALVARRVPALVVTAGMQCAGVLAGLVLVLATREALPDAGAILASVGAGLVSAAALVAFYRAFATGRATVVAPVSATGVAIPVIVGIARGERPGPVVAVGIVCALVGVIVVLATAGSGETAHASVRARTPVLFALIAAAGFGAFLVLSDRAADGGVPWFVLIARLAAAIPLVIIVAIVRPQLPPLRSRLTAGIVLIGLLDGAAWATSGAAFTRGDLAVVAVIVGLYPVITVLLATAYLRERVRPIEAAGVVAALAGVILIAGG